MTSINGATVFVTGANRGIGAEFVKQLLEHGAAQIYAGVRNPDAYEAPNGVTPVKVDVTDPKAVTAAAALAPDVNVLINNAGVAIGQPVVGGDIDAMKREFDVNVFGPLRMASAFAPALKANGGGSIINVLSAVSWFAFPGQGSYSASKAAMWLISDALRSELNNQGTQVLSMFMGAVETDLGQQFPLENKATPADVVAGALKALENGQSEAVVDDVAGLVKSLLTTDVASRYAAILGG